MTKRIKIGQIGIGHNHGEGKMLAVQKRPDLFEVIGYAEEDENWVKNRGSLPAYRDLPRLSVQEIIDQADAVLVETDVWNLTMYAAQCVKAGKHVHIDKPASGTLEEFKELLDIAQKNSLIVQMGYMYRYNPAVQKCLEMVRSGELGEIYVVDAEMSTYHSNDYRTWLKNFKGGSMYIFGVHLIDLIMLILGQPKNIIPLIKQTQFHDIIADDNCFAIMEYERAIAKVTSLSVEVNGWGMRRLAVMGSLGTVEIKPIEVKVHMTKSTAELATHEYSDLKEEIDVDDVPNLERYDRMLEDFYEYIVGTKGNPFTYEHEYAVQKVLYEIIEM